MSSSILYYIALLVAAASSGRIDPILQAAVEKNGETEAIVEFPEVINQISAIDSMCGDAKVDRLITSLKQLNAEMQTPLVTAAASLGLSTEQFWIANTVSVKGLTAEKLSDLAKIAGDFNVRPENKAFLPPMIQTPAADNGKTAQWGVETIRAPEYRSNYN
ncbi:hypothetical protein Fcan01_11545 [Folsomia candida]|uniref:Uncharacterized protein n=1 Tax=Folsomia candida TaxID=158441 RepID=A0A226E8D1_FOLCA|nr:hypothetical protein Fcan01_11545 [Folsomia candida]